MRNQTRASNTMNSGYNVSTSRFALNQQPHTCSIFGFFDEVYNNKKQTQKKNNKQNANNQDLKGIAESWVRQVEFEVINQMKPQSSGISVRTQFKQSNMMKSTMCKSNATQVQTNRRLRVKTLNKNVLIDKRK